MRNIQSGAELLDRAESSLQTARHAQTPSDRFVAAQLAALRAAAAVLAVRGRPKQGSRPQSVWRVLPTVAPELREWSAVFAAGGRRRAALAAGRSDVISRRCADDLLRDGEAFVGIAGQLITVDPATSPPAAACTTVGSS
ncbi:MAG: SAV_6107 family HEPN domain-containing protein [Angustibacter sp.]